MYQITSYGETYKIDLVKKEYTDGGLAIRADYFDEEMQGWLPYAFLTVNLGRQNYGYAYVDINNCPWAEDFIEENGLVRVKVSCYYAEPGARTADGSVPIEGMVSSNTEHLGMDMVLYTDDLMPEARFQCTDIGGHRMLQDGTAVDFYRSDYSRCVSFVKDHSPYVWVQWVEREEAEDETVSGNSVE